MKVDAARYRIVPTRTFLLWWIAYGVPALFLYFFLDHLMAAGDAWVYLAVAIQSALLLAMLALAVYGVCMGVRSARTSIYPPLGSYVLSGWKTAEGRRARILGLIVAAMAGFTFASTLILLLVLIRLQ